MPKSPSNQPVVLPIIGAIITNAKHAAVLLLGLALIAGPPQIVFGQSSQQQEQQRREQQEREQQQHDQQQRDQQQREQQQRDQQQRDQQQREQQAREQQQRDQQQREQQHERERQQRDQQQREQQAREQQQRDQQQREQQAREQQQRDQQQPSFSDSAAQTSNARSEGSRVTAVPPSTEIKRTTSEVQPLGAGRKIESAPAANAKEIKDHVSSPGGPDSRRSSCEDGPCKTPAPKPVQLQPIASDLERKCKDGPCQPCPVGQSAGKNGSCVPVPSARTAAPLPAARTVVQQPCAAGQVWNGIQCQIIGAQQCLPGQSRVGAICQDCAISTGSALGIIERVRSARQSKDQICLKNSTGMECQQAEADYDLTLSEYRSFLAGVPMECQMGLPDPIAI